jgi:hypothetical protein
MKCAERDIQRFIYAGAPIFCAKVLMVFMFVKSTGFFARYFIVLHYHTVFYFFGFFFIFVPYTNKNIGGTYYVGTRMEVRGVGYMGEMSMENVCAITQSWVY